MATIEQFLYLSQQDVIDVNLSMRAMIDLVEDGFREKGAGRVEMPPKPGIHPGSDSFIHAMPAFVPAAGAAGLKWVSGYPDNPRKGLPYISGLLILNDPETGLPVAVMDCVWITAMRTGAATAVAAKYLARADSSTVGIVACGVQGRSNLRALACLFDLDEVKAYDIDPEIAAEFARSMGESLQLEIEPVESLSQAVRQMDIVVTSGPILKKPAPAIEAGWLQQGSFACPLDFDSYWQGEALAEADQLVTDDRQQMEYYRSTGYFRQTPVADADLGEIVVGSKPGRQSDRERIISIHLGLALEDMVVARRIYQYALEQGIGRRLPL